MSATYQDAYYASRLSPITADAGGFSMRKGDVVERHEPRSEGIKGDTANSIGNSTNNEWFIWWTADPSGPASLDVFALRMPADGTLMPVFAVKADAAKNAHPHGAWSSTSNQYFVTYQDKGAGAYNILAAKISGGRETVVASSITIADAKSSPRSHSTRPTTLRRSRT